MVLLQPIQRLVGIVGAPAQACEEEGVFLGVVHAFGKQVEVLKHCAEYPRIRQRPSGAGQVSELAKPIEHARDRPVLGLDDANGGMHGALHREALCRCYVARISSP